MRRVWSQEPDAPWLWVLGSLLPTCSEPWTSHLTSLGPSFCTCNAQRVNVPCPIPQRQAVEVERINTCKEF